MPYDTPPPMSTAVSVTVIGMPIAFTPVDENRKIGSAPWISSIPLLSVNGLSATDVDHALRPSACVIVPPGGPGGGSSCARARDATRRNPSTIISRTFVMMRDLLVAMDGLARFRAADPA